MAPLVRLRSASAELLLAPMLGGGVVKLRLDGKDVLRPADAGALERGDPLGLSEFPMAPFVNRLASGRFFWAGREIALKAETGADEVIHGLTWRRPWGVASAQERQAVLYIRLAESPGWPFAFEATRRFALTQTSLSIETELRALGAGPMPASIGLHPFFPAHGAHLQASCAAMWATAKNIPVRCETGPLVGALAAGAPVIELPVDNCFVGWNGRAHIQWPHAALEISATAPARFLQVYAPQGEDYFCVEPQTAMPDAFNRDFAISGARALAPGETLRMGVEMTIRGLERAP